MQINMPRVAIGFGIILIIVGFMGGILAFHSGANAITSLIPAFFGVPITIAGMLALKENLQMHAMHSAAGIALIGFLIPGFMVAKSTITGVYRSQLAFSMQFIMAVICLCFVTLCFLSFKNARRKRAEVAQSET